MIAHLACLCSPTRPCRRRNLVCRRTSARGPGKCLLRNEIDRPCTNLRRKRVNQSRSTIHYRNPSRLPRRCSRICRRRWRSRPRTTRCRIETCREGTRLKSVSKMAWGFDNYSRLGHLTWSSSSPPGQSLAPSHTRASSKHLLSSEEQRNLGGSQAKWNINET